MEFTQWFVSPMWSGLRRTTNNGEGKAEQLEVHLGLQAMKAEGLHEKLESPRRLYLWNEVTIVTCAPPSAGHVFGPRKIA
jgi:hypothetical protein